jgi:hypothetical protein
MHIFHHWYLKIKLLFFWVVRYLEIEKIIHKNLNEIFVLLKHKTLQQFLICI